MPITKAIVPPEIPGKTIDKPKTKPFKPMRKKDTLFFIFDNIFFVKKIKEQL